jgi:RNA polymerase sigma-70 factor (ECF subfamily)
VRAGTARTQTGDPADLGAVISAYETPLLRYVGQLVGSGRPGGADAEDVVQETFLRLHRYVERKGAASVRSVSRWLFRAAHNLALDSVRRRVTHEKARKRVRDEAARRAADLEGENSPEGLAALVRRAACERALEELQKLPAQQRHVLLLKVIQDMTMREIAVVTGTSLGGVAYNLNQALKELARRLKAAGVI